MTLIEQNDLLRTEFKGGVVLISPTVAEFPPWFRGRALFRMTLAKKFTRDDHSEGVFVWAGYTWYWKIEMFAGQRSINLFLGSEF